MNAYSIGTQAVKCLLDFIAIASFSNSLSNSAKTATTAEANVPTTVWLA
ncbi:hypothetical protein M1Q06_04050 [Planococcus sp. 11815]